MLAVFRHFQKCLQFFGISQNPWLRIVSIAYVLHMFVAIQSLCPGTEILSGG